MTVVLVLAAAALGLSLHLAATALVGVLLGARIEEGRFGFGPKVVVARSPVVSVGCVPLGGWVRFVGAVETPGESAPPDAFLDLSRLRRAVISIAGPLAVLAVSAALLGPLAAVESAGETPRQLLGILSPDTLRTCFGAIAAMPPLALLGGVLAKLAMVNLLPIPTLAGGDFVAIVLGLSSATRERFALVGALVLGVGFIALVVSMTRALIS